MDYSLNSIEQCLQIMDKMKLMCNEDDDIEIFDEALYKVRTEADMSAIERLCNILDDKTEGPCSAMEDILNTIFYISEKYKQLEQGIYIFLSNSYKMIKYAVDWYEMFHRMVLWTPNLYEYYISAIKRLDKQNLEILLHTLHNIKKEDIEKDNGKNFFEEKVDFIIKSIK
ncbi:Imm30 family immunity protein [Clostridium sp. MD294]|uniref:Imm30 family immunity protein n=1 Tax=Clostridium sp. MD294 TaxID=97138 RepID=UPI0002CA5899|nr:Imm30 family immunity protein [Clostridium sp. MD294]NDO46921.1 hypothetical protein [Clostridium sp. MD294]USF28636.1 hypothetical protein C820_000010 [Clostridium sp. MD294]USF31415.1 hypothetical protein C820_002861 [Clostridium sp. MD294]